VEASNTLVQQQHARVA